MELKPVPIKSWTFLGMMLVLGLSIFMLTSGVGEKKNLVGQKPNDNWFIPNLPNELSFAGEKVPKQDIESMERLDREMLVNTFWHSNTILMLKRAHRHFPVIEKILKEEGVPDDFKYLCMIESGLDNVVSPAGAAGFWQFLRSTGKEYGLEVDRDVDERYHLEKATKAACEYLKNSKKNLGSWTLAAAAYNMGEAGVKRQLESQGVDSYYSLYLNPETARYVFRILAAKEIHSHPAQYGFELTDDSKYQEMATREVKVNSNVADWPEWALKQGTNYKYLKWLNPWIRERSLKNSTGKSYTVLLPKNSKPKKDTDD